MPQKTSATEGMSSRNLNIIAAAAEHMNSTAVDGNAGHAGSGAGAGGDASPTRRSKLVLPNLTPAMQQDLALTKASPRKAAKPLSIESRKDYADYALEGITTPHPNDVCECHSPLYSVLLNWTCP